MSTVTTPRTAAPSTARRTGRDLDVDLVVAVRRLAYRPSLWRNAVRFDPAQRTWTRIPSTGLDVEAWLLTWLPGQSTAIHDHGGARGAFVVVDGRLDEDTVEQDLDGRSVVRRRTLEAGDVRSLGPDHVHQVGNNGDGPAVSIHVYAPALTTMRTFELDGYDLVQVAEEHKELGW